MSLPETKDKNFNSTAKLIAWVISCIITIAALTVTVTKYIKSEMNETVKVSIQLAIAELLYEVKDFKDIKTTVYNHEKTLSLLTYRVGAMEDRQFKPHISKEFEKPEENEGVVIEKNDKDK